MLKVFLSLLQPRLLLRQLGLVLDEDGIDVGVVVAGLHQFLLDPILSSEEELVTLALHSIVDGKDLVELGNLGISGMQTENGGGDHGCGFQELDMKNYL